MVQFPNSPTHILGCTFWGISRFHTRLVFQKQTFFLSYWLGGREHVTWLGKKDVGNRSSLSLDFCFSSSAPQHAGGPKCQKGYFPTHFHIRSGVSTAIPPDVPTLLPHCPLMFFLLYPGPSDCTQVVGAGDKIGLKHLSLSLEQITMGSYFLRDQKKGP